MKTELCEKTGKLVYAIVETNVAMQCLYEHCKPHQYQREKMLDLIAELKIVLEADMVLDCMCGSVHDGLLIFHDRTSIENYLRAGKTLEEDLALAENGRMCLDAYSENFRHTVPKLSGT